MRRIVLTSQAVAGLAIGAPTLATSQTAGPSLSLTNITEATVSDLKSRTLHGPFLGANFPDPCIIWGDGSWKAYATSSNGKKIPVATASNPSTGWTLTGEDALPDPGPWVDANDQGIWAPDVQKNVRKRQSWDSLGTSEC